MYVLHINMKSFNVAAQMFLPYLSSIHQRLKIKFRLRLMVIKIFFYHLLPFMRKDFLPKPWHDSWCNLDQFRFIFFTPVHMYCNNRIRDKSRFYPIYFDQIGQIVPLGYDLVNGLNNLHIYHDSGGVSAINPIQTVAISIQYLLATLAAQLQWKTKGDFASSRPFGINVYNFALYSWWTNYKLDSTGSAPAASLSQVQLW